MKTSSLRNPRGGLQAKPGQTGVALVVVLILAGVISIIALMAAYSARTELRIAYNQFRQLQALYSAEAGLNHSYRLLVMNPANLNTILGTGGPGPGQGTFPTADIGAVQNIGGLNYNFRQFGGSGTDGYYVRVEDNLDEPTGADNPNQDADGKVRIVSRGWAGDARRAVEGIISTSPGYCMFGTNNGAGEKSIEVYDAGTLVDSYNASAGAYAVATAGSDAQAGSNREFYVYNGARIQGNATAAGVFSVTPPADITGSETPSAPQQTFTAIPPCTSWTTTGISGSYTLSSGELKVDGGNASLAAGNYCFNNLILDNGASLTVAGPVTITLDHLVDIKNNSRANFPGGNPGLPSNLRVLLTDPSGTTLVYLSGGAQAAMTVYGPNVKADISGAAQLFGSVVGRWVVLNGGAKIHCDTSAGLTTTGTIGGGTQLIGWHELP